MGKILHQDRTIVPALDVSSDKMYGVVQRTFGVDGIEAYKIGIMLMLDRLDLAVEAHQGRGRKFYNHWAGATDIPDLGKQFMAACEGHVDGVILSFLSGPATAEKWLAEAAARKLDVIGEGYLGHHGFLKEDGGYISFESVQRMHQDLLNLGVRQFILPRQDDGTEDDRAGQLETLVKAGGGNVFWRNIHGHNAGEVEADITEITPPEAIRHSLPFVVEIIKDNYGKKVILDHQKAGTWYPGSSETYLTACAAVGGIDALILFSQAGQASEEAYIRSAQAVGLNVIEGGLMTHPKYAESDGGYIADDRIMQMYLVAAGLGVRDFVVPGNKPVDIQRIRSGLEEKGYEPTLWAPGFIKQKGRVEDAAAAMGQRRHCIIGEAIYGAQPDDMNGIARKLVELNRAA
jgi:orotidine-5'-phosphate decarboxylase